MTTAAANEVPTTDRIWPANTTVHNLLVENGQLIETIAGYQRIGKYDEVPKYMELLYKNIVHLANLGDPESVAQIQQALLRENSHQTTRELAGEAECDRSTIVRHLKSMEKVQKLVDFHKMWFLSEDDKLSAVCAMKSSETRRDVLKPFKSETGLVGASFSAPHQQQQQQLQGPSLNPANSQSITQPTIAARLIAAPPQFMPPAQSPHGAAITAPTSQPAMSGVSPAAIITTMPNGIQHSAAVGNPQAGTLPPHYHPQQIQFPLASHQPSISMAASQHTTSTALSQDPAIVAAMYHHHHHQQQQQQQQAYGMVHSQVGLQLPQHVMVLPQHQPQLQQVDAAGVPTIPSSS